MMEENFTSKDGGCVTNTKPVLITGGAGFIGTNLALRLMSLGQRVIIYDNLSRAGVEHNLQWMKRHFADQMQVILADVRDRHALSQAVDAAGQVFHFAAQVAVTTSVETPMRDFEVNAAGTLNLLESIRTSTHKPPLVFTSTNKVYGSMDSMPLGETAIRYEPANESMLESGIDETCPLSFYSPYGCSKGTADQYVLDYARTYGLWAVVFRMSCIYGPYQQGSEDQGWVAHFLIRALEEQPITIYGDGKQVRDVLFVEDLVNAFLLAQQHIGHLSGQAFNIGGGPQNTASLLELIELIGRIDGRRVNVLFDHWRLGDQRYYVSNTSKFQSLTGWRARSGVDAGVRMLYNWLKLRYGAAKRVLSSAEVVR
jgi:CDP-paratose 2-epimerase